MEFLDALSNFWESSGIYNFDIKTIIMIVISFLLMYLAIVKNFEPLLLLPIGFGGLLANIPMAGKFQLPEESERVFVSVPGKSRFHHADHPHFVGTEQFFIESFGR